MNMGLKSYDKALIKFGYLKKSTLNWNRQRQLRVINFIFFQEESLDPRVFKLNHDRKRSETIAPEQNILRNL